MFVLGATFLSSCAGPGAVLRDLPGRPVVGQPSIAPIVHWEEIREYDGKKVHFHMVRADLDDDRCEVRVACGDDPDGPDGPAVSRLVNPVRLAQAHGLAVGVNANAFLAAPNASGIREMARGWYLGKPIIPVGHVVVDGTSLEGCQHERLMVWIDRDNRAHTGETPDLTTVQQGVSDWGGDLLRHGEYVSTQQGPNHRSMAGTDATGRWLFLLVADGAARGTRNGATFRECADVLLENGCTEAIALDGGGSVVMTLAHPAEVKPNRWIEGPVVESSGRTDLRPVPVMFGLSARRKSR